MSNKKIAIIDDDPFVVAHLKSVLQKRIPDADVDGVIEPVAPAGYDVYIVDKDFDGDSKGQEVVRRLRSLSPYCLVLAYSANLDKDFLCGLLREGCEGAFDKGSLEELDSMVTTIELFLSQGSSKGAAFKGVFNTLRAITGLVKEWNVRLNDNGRVHTKRYRDA